VAYSRSRAEFNLNRDGSAATGTRILRELRQWSSAPIAQAPKLKAFCVDCFLDRIARQVVGRSFVRCYCPGSSPGTVLARKFVHVGVAGESAQPVRSLLRNCSINLGTLTRVCVSSIASIAIATSDPRTLRSAQSAAMP
jgi:hypothetical protein